MLYASKLAPSDKPPASACCAPLLPLDPPGCNAAQNLMVMKRGWDGSAAVETVWWWLGQLAVDLPDRWLAWEIGSSTV